MKLLAIGAHPDDIEIFMYGLVASCLKRGDDIFLAVATDGAAGKVLTTIDLKKKRASETLQGLSKLAKPELLNLPDGQLSYCKDAYSIIESFIFDVNPDFIITHDKKDYHPDHRALSRIVSEIAGFKYPIFYAETLMGLNFKPNYYIDITEYFSAKVDAILAHKTQKPEKFVQVAKIMNGYRAAQCNAPKGFFSECYRVNKTFPFGDIRSLLPTDQKIRPYYNNSQNSLL